MNAGDNALFLGSLMPMLVLVSVKIQLRFVFSGPLQSLLVAKDSADRLVQMLGEG